MKCATCNEDFNPEFLSEVLTHEHIDGLTCDPGITGEIVSRKYSITESANVAEIAYNRARLEFDLEFQNGNRYRYFDVPHDLFSRAVESPSIGAFVASDLKGHYRYARIN